jgi:hypothetical protein
MDLLSKEKNSLKLQGRLGHMIVHIIPRKAGDKSNNDDIYIELETYPDEYAIPLLSLLNKYNTKIN